jgi:plasmid stabilization system protein ParE
MSLRVVILQSAEADLKELRTYLLRQFSSQTWQSTYIDLKAAILGLADLPLSGSIPEEIEKLNLGQYRQIVCGMNRVIYEVREKSVFVHIIVDTRKSLPALLMKRLLNSNP